jgi:hypothetical protein
MAAEIPTVEPTVIVSGDTSKWYKSIGDYSPDDSWVLTYQLVPQFTDSSGDPIDPTAVVAADNSDGRWLATVSATVSGARAAGDYKWYSRVSKGAETFTTEQGTLTIKPDPTDTSYDARSHVKITLDALQATLEGKATKDQEAWTVEGRSVSRYSFEELRVMLDKYRRWYKDELAAEDLARGLSTGRTIKVRF